MSACLMLMIQTDRSEIKARSHALLTLTLSRYDSPSAYAKLSYSIFYLINYELSNTLLISELHISLKFYKIVKLVPDFVKCGLH